MGAVKSQSECDMNNPDEFAVWALAAGVPDPRNAPGMPNLPLIPPMCFASYSRLLWDLGFRWHEDKQTKWVAAAGGFGQVSPTVDVKPEEVPKLAVEMLADQFPEVAAKLTAVSPETRDQEAAAAARKLLESLDRLREAQAKFGGGA